MTAACESGAASVEGYVRLGTGSPQKLRQQILARLDVSTSPVTKEISPKDKGMQREPPYKA